MLALGDQRLLIIAPHPDDEVFGCGGLIRRCKSEGGQVFVLFLTVGTTKDFSAKGASTQDERLKEIEQVASFLQFDGYRIAFPGNDYHLQLDVLPQKDLIDAIERGEEISLQALKPTIVALPFPSDYNQDHRAACFSTLAALRPQPPTFKHRVPLVLHYELPPCQWTTRPEAPTVNFFLDLTEQELAAKTEALQLYQSQMKNPQGPISPYGAATLAAFRGLQCGTTHAEAYFSKRLLL